MSEQTAILPGPVTRDGSVMLEELIEIARERHRDCEVLGGLVVFKFENQPGFRAVMFNAETGKWTLGDFYPEQFPDFLKWMDKMCERVKIKA